MQLQDQFASAVNDPIGNMFCNLAADGGRIFGSWIDEDSRNNGYDAGDLISNPAYIIESLLRDELGLVTAQIDITSFDAAGNTSDGTLDGWEFCGGIYNVANLRDILNNILLQCKSQLYRDPCSAGILKQP